MMFARPLVFSIMALAASPVAAGSPFNGTWKVDFSRGKPSANPMHVLLKDGIYSCDCLFPDYRFKADGAFHPPEASRYAFDTSELAVSIDDLRTVTVRHRDKGKIVFNHIFSVSPDGNTLTETWTDLSAPNGRIVTGSSISRRVAPATNGSHAISGVWQQIAIDARVVGGLTTFVRLDGARLSVSSPNGVSYEALLGGPATVPTGAPPGVTIKVSNSVPNEIVETEWQNNELLFTTTRELAEDARTMTVMELVPGRSTGSSYVMRKQ